MAPTLVASRDALPPGDAAPAARQSRFRGPCLKGWASTRFAACIPLPQGEALRLRPGKAGFAALAGEERPASHTALLRAQRG